MKHPHVFIFLSMVCSLLLLPQKGEASVETQACDGKTVTEQESYRRFAQLSIKHIEKATIDANANPLHRHEILRSAAKEVIQGTASMNGTSGSRSYDQLKECLNSLRGRRLNQGSACVQEWAQVEQLIQDTLSLMSEVSACSLQALPSEAKKLPAGWEATYADLRSTVIEVGTDLRKETFRRIALATAESVKADFFPQQGSSTADALLRRELCAVLPTLLKVQRNQLQAELRNRSSSEAAARDALKSFDDAATETKKGCRP